MLARTLRGVVLHSHRDGGAYVPVVALGPVGLVYLRCAVNAENDAAYGRVGPRAFDPETGDPVARFETLTVDGAVTCNRGRLFSGGPRFTLVVREVVASKPLNPAVGTVIGLLALG